jgi:hypothetical protein
MEMLPPSVSILAYCVTGGTTGAGSCEAGSQLLSNITEDNKRNKKGFVEGFILLFIIRYSIFLTNKITFFNHIKVSHLCGIFAGFWLDFLYFELLRKLYLM